MAQKPKLRLRRIYDDVSDDDGIRVLVDRRWPRGVSRTRAHLDEWCKDVAPSDDLRRWYGHDPDKFEQFRQRYRTELEDPVRAAALRHLLVMSTRDQVTLLTATKNPGLSQAAVLVELLRDR